MSSIENWVTGNIRALEEKTDVLTHGQVRDGLLCLEMEDGHFANVYPSDEVLLNIISQIDKEKSILPEQVAVRDPTLSTEVGEQRERKIVFQHKRALGDEVMFSAGVRDFKLLFPHIRINVQGNHMALWDNNPYLDRTVKQGDPDVEFYRVGYKPVGTCNNTYIHFSQMFLLDMIAQAHEHEPLPIGLGEFTAAFGAGEVGDPEMGNPDKNPKAREPFISLKKKYRHFCRKFSRMRGDLHMTEAEKRNDVIKNHMGIEKYWLIAPGGKRDCTSKIWDWREFQQVIDYFKGRIQFVVMGKGDLLIEKLRGVIDMVDKYNSDHRGLLSLVYNADGCISGPSALMHLAAAVPMRETCLMCDKPRHECGCKKPKFSKFWKPCVDIFGGREPTGWCHYSGHQVLHTNATFDCCAEGGCWTARTVPLQKDPKHNNSLCKQTIVRDGRTVQACMAAISAADVIRAIEKYYDGNMLRYMQTEETWSMLPMVVEQPKQIVRQTSSKEINLVGNLNSKGGGEQSFYMIAQLLQASGWTVHLHPWSTTNDKFKDGKVTVSQHSFKNGMANNMVPGLPLLFYGNDCIWDFAKAAQPVVEKSSKVVIGINFMNGDLPKCGWLSSSHKLKAVIFQNTEKKMEWIRDAIGFNGTEYVVMFGAIDLNQFLEVCPPKRNKDDTLVVLKHCMPDGRKWTTKEQQTKGERVHTWQKHFQKDTDVRFYERLLKDTKNTRFEFMEAHQELESAFPNEPRMVFHKWDAMPVGEFLSRGHLYLYRTANSWRDQYPRVIAEALAAGLPVLCEPRDGPIDRVVYGDTGAYCVDYDEFKEWVKKLQRKEDYRHQIGMNAKDWARENLDPRRWVDEIERLVVDEENIKFLGTVMGVILAFYVFQGHQDKIMDRKVEASEVETAQTMQNMNHATKLVLYQTKKDLADGELKRICRELRSKPNDPVLQSDQIYWQEQLRSATEKVQELMEVE